MVVLRGNLRGRGRRHGVGVVAVCVGPHHRAAAEGKRLLGASLLLLLAEGHQRNTASGAVPIVVVHVARRLRVPLRRVGRSSPLVVIRLRSAVNVLSNRVVNLCSAREGQLRRGLCRGGGGCVHV